MELSVSYAKPYGELTEIQELLFLADHHRIKKVTLPMNYVKIGQKFRKSPVIAAIDYPDGCSLTDIRICSILTVIKFGVVEIDVVARNDLLTNRSITEFNRDILACVTLGKANKIKVNVILDYALYPASFVIDIAKGLKKLGAASIITGSGRFGDDIIDNLIISNQISAIGIDVVVASNDWSWSVFDKMKNSALGVRFTSTPTIRSVLGDYIR